MRIRCHRPAYSRAIGMHRNWLVPLTSSARSRRCTGRTSPASCTVSSRCGIGRHRKSWDRRYCTVCSGARNAGSDPILGCTLNRTRRSGARCSKRSGSNWIRSTAASCRYCCCRRYRRRRRHQSHRRRRRRGCLGRRRRRAVRGRRAVRRDANGPSTCERLPSGCSRRRLKPRADHATGTAVFGGLRGTRGPAW